MRSHKTIVWSDYDLWIFRKEYRVISNWPLVHMRCKEVARASSLIMSSALKFVLEAILGGVANPIFAPSDCLLTPQLDPLPFCQGFLEPP